MANIKSNDILEMNENVIRQKADSALSIIKNINRQGGVKTQLMMAAACIEVQDFVYYLEMITHTESDIEINSFLNCSNLEKYIRHFKDAQHELVYRDDPSQRECELNIIANLKEEISMESYHRLLKYSNEAEYIDSWATLNTDISMLWDILYSIIENAILELDSIYYMIRDKTDDKPTS